MKVVPHHTQYLCYLLNSLYFNRNNLEKRKERKKERKKERLPYVSSS